MELWKQDNEEQWSLQRFLKAIQSTKIKSQVPRSKHGRRIFKERRKTTFSALL